METDVSISAPTVYTVPVPISTIGTGLSRSYNWRRFPDLSRMCSVYQIYRYSLAQLQYHYIISREAPRLYQTDHAYISHLSSEFTNVLKGYLENFTPLVLTIESVGYFVHNDRTYAAVVPER